MANQAVGDIILTTFDGLWHGQRIISTFYWRVNAVVGTPLVTAFAAAIDTQMRGAGQMYPKFLACVPPQYFFNNLWVQTVAPTRYVKDTFVVAMSGTFGATSNIPNTATVITRKGDVANRHNIGSLHLPMANLDVTNSNGTIGANQLTANNALASQMLNSIVLAGFGGMDPVLWFKPLATNYSVIRRTSSQLTTRVMRRRTVGVGK